MDSRTDPAMDNLREAIEQLYSIFAVYPLRQYIEASPNRIGARDQEHIRSKPLRCLSGDDLRLYSGKALTTWGIADDYKHFLPRLLELVTTDDNFNHESITTKLQRADWRTWPLPEKNAIESFLKALWQFVLSSFPAQPIPLPAEYWLTFIARIVTDLTPHLQLWRHNESVSSLRHLAQFVQNNTKPLLEAHRLDHYWHGLERSMNQAIAWMSEPATKDALERAFFTYEHEAYAEEFATAVNQLDWVQDVL